MAVFLMLFIFIAIVCFAAVVVIAFTRSLTIAITNRPVYDDLRRMGAPAAYLNRSPASQVPPVLLAPTVAGTSLIFAFYTMILYFNDNRFTLSEVLGLRNCLALAVLISLGLYGVYRLTRRSAAKILGL